MPLSDFTIPNQYADYVQLESEQKTGLIQSGVLARSPTIDRKLAGGGNTFNLPAFNDLADDDENISSDETDDKYVSNQSANSKPKGVNSVNEVAVRLSRNQSWAENQLVDELIGTDPIAAIAGRLSTYWARRLQAASIAVLSGVFADNAADPTGSEHNKNDLTSDISGDAYSDGVTNFSGSAFINAISTIGDSYQNLRTLLVHSNIFNKIKQNDLIDYKQESQASMLVPTYQGMRLVVDDSIPEISSGIYQSFMLGDGALRYGSFSPANAVETARNPDAGNGSGEDVLYSRVNWSIHPVGHAFIGTSTKGGPSNKNESGQLAHADSWKRAYPERKQIHIARLITREHAPVTR